MTYNTTTLPQDVNSNTSNFALLHILVGIVVIFVVITSGVVLVIGIFIHRYRRNVKPQQKAGNYCDGLMVFPVLKVI